VRDIRLLSYFHTSLVTGAPVTYNHTTITLCGMARWAIGFGSKM